MVSKTLFQSLRGMLLPSTNTVNEAGGTAYQMSPQQALAQYAATGCLNQTFYATAEDQLAQVLVLCGQVEPEFIARVALYARTKGYNEGPAGVALCCALGEVTGTAGRDFRSGHRLPEDAAELCADHAVRSTGRRWVACWFRRRMFIRGRSASTSSAR